MAAPTADYDAEFRRALAEAYRLGQDKREREILAGLGAAPNRPHA